MYLSISRPVAPPRGVPLHLAKTLYGRELRADIQPQGTAEGLSAAPRPPASKEPMVPASSHGFAGSSLLLLQEPPQVAALAKAAGGQGMRVKAGVTE